MPPKKVTVTLPDEYSKLEDSFTYLAELRDKLRSNQCELNGSSENAEQCFESLLYIASSALDSAMAMKGFIRLLQSKERLQALKKAGDP